MGLKRTFLKAALRHLWVPRPSMLWRRYAVALALITLVITVAHAAALSPVRIGATYSDLQQISSRQVMLSQRIMYYVHSLALLDDPERRNRLKSAIRLFEDSNEWLMSNPDLSERVRAHYLTDGDIPLDPFSRRYAALASSYMDSSGQEKRNIQNQIAEWGEDALLSSLSRAVRLIEADIDANAKLMMRVQKIALATALFVLLMEAIFIFLPAQLSVARTFKRLERRGQLLRRSTQALTLRNEQLTAARQDLDHLANHDAMTGLFNRRALLASLSDKLDRQSREGGVLGLLKIDLDFFKSVNDAHGHRAGDQVLAVVAERLLDAAGPEDVVARIGGDEFVVLVGDVGSVPGLKIAAETIITHLREPIATDAARCQIGASIGLTVTNARDATRDQLLLEADLALYEAKREGRCRVRVYSKLLQQEITSRRSLLTEIAQALENDEFDAYLQPQVDLATGELYGCEMLARWHHPKQGLVLPRVFLDAARQAGLLRQIDLAVTSRALDMLEMLRADGINLPRISVNACAETLRDPHYVDWLRQALCERLLKPDDLTVEILESTLIENDNDVVLRTVQGLTTLGIAVVLDDFGTGYATMATLSRLRLSGIKIDRSLIEPLPGDRARSIVAALVALSRNLDMKVVAEGVEAPRHFEAVEALGCDIVQGYGISRPMSVAAFRLWYAEFTGSARQVSSG